MGKFCGMRFLISVINWQPLRGLWIFHCFLKIVFFNELKNWMADPDIDKKNSDFSSCLAKMENCWFGKKLRGKVLMETLLCRSTKWWVFKSFFKLSKASFRKRFKFIFQSIWDFQIIDLKECSLFPWQSNSKIPKICLTKTLKGQIFLNKRISTKANSHKNFVKCENTFNPKRRKFQKHIQSSINTNFQAIKKFQKCHKIKIKTFGIILISISSLPLAPKKWEIKLGHFLDKKINSKKFSLFFMSFNLFYI